MADLPDPPKTPKKRGRPPKLCPHGVLGKTNCKPCGNLYQREHRAQRQKLVDGIPPGVGLAITTLAVAVLLMALNACTLGKNLEEVVPTEAHLYRAEFAADLPQVEQAIQAHLAKASEEERVKLLKLACRMEPPPGHWGSSFITVWKFAMEVIRQSMSPSLSGFISSHWGGESPSFKDGMVGEYDKVQDRWHALGCKSLLTHGRPTREPDCKVLQDRISALKSKHRQLEEKKSDAAQPLPENDDVESSIPRRTLLEMKDSMSMSDYVKSLVERATERYDKVEESFAFRLAVNQFEQLGAGSTNIHGLRYDLEGDKALVHFTHSHQFAGGGRSSALLRGSGRVAHRTGAAVSTTESLEQDANEEAEDEQGGGPDDTMEVDTPQAATEAAKPRTRRVDPTRFNIFLPSIDAAQKYIPTHKQFRTLEETYSLTAVERVRIFKKARAQAGEQSPTVILAADEMDIRGGLVWMKRLGILIGHVDGVLHLNQLQGWTEANNIKGKLATHALQVFMIDTSGRGAVPLVTIPTIKADATAHYKHFKKLIKLLQREGVTVIGGSTDNFSGSDSFVQKMQDKFGDAYGHLFDFSHVVKGLRNGVKNAVITDEDGNCFSLRDLYNAWKQEETLRKYVADTDIYPTDVMEMGPIRKLLNPNFVAVLRSHPTQAVKALARYLTNVAAWYNLFVSHTPLEKKLARFKELADYFASLSGLTDELQKAIAHTYAALVKLKNRGQAGTAMLSTLIVENFFSIVRSKLRYPNFYEFQYVANRAFMELVKRNALDCPYSFPDSPVGRCYGDQTGTRYTMADVGLIRPCEKKRELAAIIRQSRQGLEDDEIQAIEDWLEVVVSHNKPKRRVGTIRDATCKQRFDGEDILANYCQLKYLTQSGKKYKTTDLGRRPGLWKLVRGG